MQETEIYLNVITGIALALLLASGLYLISKRSKFLPFPILLFVIGIVLSNLNFQLFESIRLNPGSVLFIFLPILLFESAFRFDFREFKRILAPGFLFATGGLLISATVIAAILHLLFKLPFAESFFYGSIISSTDPIAVLSLFKELGVPKRLQLLVDGESFLNDATSVIMYKLLLPVIGTGVYTGFASSELISGVGSFAYVLIGGAVVGALFGWVVSEVISPIKNVPLVEISLTIILASLVFIFAEHYLQVSGIIAVLAAGLVLGNYGRSKISPQILNKMDEIWEFLIFISTSLVFLLIGYEINIPLISTNLPIVIAAVLALLLGRFLSIYLIGAGYNLSVPRESRIPASWLQILNFGGLRGVLPLVVVLSLPETFAYRDLFIQLVLASILFTLTINVVLITPLIQLLKLDKPTRAELIEAGITQVFVLKSLLHHLRKMKDTEEICFETYAKHVKDVKQRLQETKTQLVKWKETTDEKIVNAEIAKVIGLHCLHIEKTVYSDLYTRGIITEDLFNRLCASINEKFILIQIDENFKPLSKVSRTNIEAKFKKLERPGLNLASLIRYIRGISFTDTVMDTYTYYKARFLGDEKVLEELASLHEESQDFPKISQIISKTVKYYEELLNYNRSTVNYIRVNYHKEAMQVEEKLFECESSDLIASMLHEFSEQGRITKNVISKLKMS